MLPPTQNAEKTPKSTGKILPSTYKKLTSADLKRKIDTSQKEIDDLQAKLSKAMDQKERFEKESRGQSVLAETTSANVIDQMF